MNPSPPKLSSKFFFLELWASITQCCGSETLKAVDMDTANSAELQHFLEVQRSFWLYESFTRMILLLIWSVIPEFSQVWVGLMHDFNLMVLIHRVQDCITCFESNFGSFLVWIMFVHFFSFFRQLIPVFAHAWITEGDTESNVNWCYTLKKGALGF